MKIIFLFNGLTHYFNLITSKINSQPGIEIFFVTPKGTSHDLGEGVFQTREGVNFTIVELEEIADAAGNLYFENLDKLIAEVQPEIILLGESHMNYMVNDPAMHAIIEKNKIKLILKSIPFRLKTYQQALSDHQQKLEANAKPDFRSMPGPVRSLLKLLKADSLYKKWVIDPKAVKLFKEELDKKKLLYNAFDGHVNYIDAAYDIYGSYDVPADKIFITYNSPDTDTYFAVKDKISKQPAILEPNPYRIIHLSRLVEWKRVDMLVKAVANMIAKYPAMELLVVGDGPEMNKLQAMAKDLGVAHAIKFLGGVYDAELFGKYIMSSSIYILAGMGGLSINDGMIFGLPVICSVCDGTEKYLVRAGENGLYFKEGDQQDLENKIARMFDDPEQTTRMGERSVKIIEEEININTVVDRYVKAFKTVAAK